MKKICHSKFHLFLHLKCRKSTRTWLRWGRTRNHHQKCRPPRSPFKTIKMPNFGSLMRSVPSPKSILTRWISWCVRFTHLTDSVTTSTSFQSLSQTFARTLKACARWQMQSLTKSTNSHLCSTTTTTTSGEMQSLTLSETRQSTNFSQFIWIKTLKRLLGCWVGVHNPASK